MYLHVDPFGFGPSGAPRYGSSPVSADHPAHTTGFPPHSGIVMSAFPNPSAPASSSTGFAATFSVGGALSSGGGHGAQMVTSVHSGMSTLPNHPMTSSGPPTVAGGPHWSNAAGRPIAVPQVSYSLVTAGQPPTSHSQPPAPHGAPLLQPASDVQAWCVETLRVVERTKHESAGRYLAAVEAAVDEYLQTTLGLARPDEVIPHDYLDVRPADLTPIAANIELLQHCAQDAFLPSSGFRRNLIGPTVHAIWRDYLHPLRQMLMRALEEAEARKAASVNVVGTSPAPPLCNTYHPTGPAAGPGAVAQTPSFLQAPLVTASPPPLPHSSSHSNLFSTGTAPPVGSVVSAATTMPSPPPPPAGATPAASAVPSLGAPPSAMEKLVRSVRLDIAHLDDMWKLECAWPGDESVQPQQRELSHIVPVAGLLLNRVHRLLNEHQTVMEHWGR